MRTLSVRLLGEFAIDGIEPQQLGSRKARSLLRLLALARGQSVSSDVLTSALWSQEQPERPAQQVAVLVSRLRAVIGRGRIEHGDGGYRLAYDWLDADELSELVDEIERRQRAGSVPGAAAAARAALSLIRGQPTGGSDEDWDRARTGDLDRLIRKAQRLAATALLSAGHWIDAADLAAGSLERDPYDEDSLRTLMRAHVSGGRVGSALAAYAATAERLRDELGSDPSTETDALHAAILRGELPRLSRPQPAGRLCGREPELDMLDLIAARSHSGTLEVVAVVGEAGIGKTSLLQAWAARRTAIGEVVLTATCGPLDRAVPLDAMIAAIAAHLRSAGPARAVDVLGSDDTLLAPLLRVHDPLLRQPALADGIVEPAILFAALLRVVERLAAPAPLVIVLDDAQWAGPAMADLLSFLQRRSASLVVVAGVRSGEENPLPANELIELGPLDRAATADLVGEARADALYEASGGHSLLLVELAAHSGESLPGSLVAIVSEQCDEMGEPAATTLRSAAVLGPEIDLDLLAEVLQQPVVGILDQVERATARRLLVDDAGAFVFRHDLVRAALAASTTAARAALLHREAGRVLARRGVADPVDIAEHARLGGDLKLASTALRAASDRASARFDHPTAEALLDEALTLHPDADGWLARARVRTLRGRYAEAYDDVDRAAPAGAAALEVGAWASYFDRRFTQALLFAKDGALTADDAAVRARCLTVGGRTHHAAGNLVQAQQLLSGALELTTGSDQVTASAWLGVVRAHQSRPEEALELLSPATRAQVGVEHTSATLHALLFTGHAHALAGRPALALESFDRYTTAVERRHVPRFAGRGTNFAGWVLRNVGARDAALDRHVEALETGRTAETTIAALEDLAEDQIERGDLAAATDRLTVATSLLRGDLVFGWRLQLKLHLLQTRIGLADGRAQEALTMAEKLADEAAAIGVPRYTSVAHLLAHQARSALGLPVEFQAVEADLDLLDRSVAVEAWWWTGETAAALKVPRWVDRAADRATSLAQQAGAYRHGLESDAVRRLDRWRAAAH